MVNSHYLDDTEPAGIVSHNGHEDYATMDTIQLDNGDTPYT